MIEELTDDSFVQEVMNTDKPSVILFTASWCTWCPDMKARLDEVSEIFGDRVRFFTADTEQQPRLRISFAVGTLPFLVLIRNGKKIPLFDEIVTSERLEERIDYVLGGGKVPMELPVRFR